MTEANFDCPEFPQSLTIREAIMMEQGCDGWAAAAIAEMYARDRMADLDVEYFFATDPAALAATFQRWRRTMTKSLTDLNGAICEAAAAFKSFGDAIRDSERAELAAHPDLAYLDAQMDGYYT